MRFAYADPPYPGLSHLYEGHPDFAGEVDHQELIERLVADYPDGWALSTDEYSLRELLPLCPERTRTLVWVKPGGKNFSRHHLWRMWEPVLMWGGRNLGLHQSQQHVSDYHVEGVSALNAHRVALIGQKPEGFCFWLFRCLGAIPGDELVDLFPGSGAVTKAWQKYQAQIPLPTERAKEKQGALVEAAQ